MGKKRVSALGSENEEVKKAKREVQREQKKLRTGKPIEPVTEPVGAQLIAPETEIKKSIKKVHKRSRAYQSVKEKVNVGQEYSLTDGLKLLRTVSIAKFDPTVELHLVLKEKGFAKDVDMPHSIGKVHRIAVANDETLAKIAAGIMDFDVLLASSEQMGKLVKFAKVLGPKGLMPNPKNGTVVTDPDKTAKAMLSKNILNLKTEKDAPLIHTIVGKLSAKDTDLKANIEAVLTAVSGKCTKAILKSTISPAIKLVI